MGQDAQNLKTEARKGDSRAQFLALSSVVLTAVAASISILRNNPTAVGWFAYHPPLQLLSVLALSYGILTLQPTSRPENKAKAADRHQSCIFLLGLPCILLGTTAIAYNKWLNGQDSMTTWHGTFGYIAVSWFCLQVTFGGVNIKRKYHRLSGYVLLSLMLITVHLGGQWSNWGLKYTSPSIRLLAYTVAPALTLVSILVRVRSNKLK